MAATTVVLFGSDRVLESLLKTDGRRITVRGLDELSAYAQSSAVAVDLAVLDLRGRKEIPAHLATFRRHHPTTGVVIVAGQLDPSLMLEAMRAGVNEWVTDPVSQADLDAAMARVTSQKAGVVRGQTFAFVGAKGGVGTTTMVVNVASALASVGGPGSTLIIDFHLAHGDASLFLGVEPRFSVVDALENTQRLDDSLWKGIVVKSKAGPDLLGSGDRAVTSMDAQRVHALLEFVSTRYKYVILDCPRSDLAVLDALESVAKVIVVANQELATVRNASRIATTLRQRYGTTKVSVVVARYDATSEIGSDDVERVIGGKVKHLFPNDYRLSVSSLNKGKPLVLENHSKLAASFDSFARELAGVPKDPDDKKSGGGLFGRWRG